MRHSHLEQLRLVRVRLGLGPQHLDRALQHLNRHFLADLRCHRLGQGQGHLDWYQGLRGCSPADQEPGRRQERCQPDQEQVVDY